MQGELEKLKKKVESYIDKNRKELIELYSKLIQIPSENPPGDVTEIASFIKDYIKARGLYVNDYQTDKGRINLVSKVKGEREMPHLVLNGHMDVVPAGDKNRWNFPPFCGEIKEGKMLGRGAADMKGGLAGLISAFVIFPNLEIQLPGALTFVAVPDEETGGHYGTRWLVEEKKIVGDACLVGEPTNLNKVEIGEKGTFWIAIEAKGEPAHGSRPVLGQNAILKIIQIISQMRKEFEMKKVRMPSIVADDIETSREVFSELAKNMGHPEKADELGKLVDHISLNVGIIKGGTKVNVVPDNCSVEMDLRLPFGITPQRIESEVNRLLDKTGLTDVDYKVIQSSKPNYTSSKERIVKILSDNVKSVLGLAPKPCLATGATDGRFYRAKGKPCVSYGMGALSQVHCCNESAPIEDLIKETKVYVTTILDFMYSY